MKNKVVAISLVSLLLLLTYFSFSVCASEDFFESANEVYNSISVKSALNAIVREIKNSFTPTFPLFSGLIGMILLSAVINTYGVHFDKFDIGEYVCIVCFSSFLFSVVKSLCETVIGYVSNLKDISAVMLPGIISASLADGALTANTSAAGASITLGVIEFIVSSVVLPCVKILFVLAITSSITASTLDLRSFSSSLRTFSVFLIGLLMTANVTVIHFQSVVAKASDGVASRALRFTAGNLLPIIGNMFGESIKTVSESLKAVGSVTGVAGVVAILSASLPPIIACMIFKVELNISACVAKTLGCTKQGMLLSDIGGILNILNAGLVVSTVGFCIVVCLLANVL